MTNISWTRLGDKARRWIHYSKATRMEWKSGRRKETQARQGRCQLATAGDWPDTSFPRYHSSKALPSLADSSACRPCRFEMGAKLQRQEPPITNHITLSATHLVFHYLQSLHSPARLADCRATLSHWSMSLPQCSFCLVIDCTGSSPGVITNR